MKKVLALVLALVMVASMAACASNSGTTEAAKPAESTSAPAATTEPAEVTWPNGNVTVYVPAAAGGGTDAFARICTQYLEKATGKTFTVINESSGNGTVACEKVRTADPDGQTVLVYHPTMLIQYYQGIYDANPTDTNNFTVIGTLQNGGDGDALVVPASAPYNTVEELVEYCKQNPGKVTFGNQNGGFGQMEALQLAAVAGIDILFVDSGAQADTITALLGKNIDVCFIQLAVAKQYEEAGDMKVLAVCNREPSKAYPEVPTLVSCGYDVALKVDMVMLAPANMDPALVNAMSEVLKGMEADADTIELNGNMKNSYTYVDPAQSQADWNKVGETIKSMVGLIGFDVSGK